MLRYNCEIPVIYSNKVLNYLFINFCEIRFIETAAIVKFTKESRLQYINTQLKLGSKRSLLPLIMLE